MFPSILSLGVGAVIGTALVIVDWYVWRLAPVKPYPVAQPANGGQTRGIHSEDDGASYRKVA